MKRLISLVMSVLFLLSCTACAKGPGSTGDLSPAGGAAPVQTDQVSPPEGNAPRVPPDGGVEPVEPPAAPGQSVEDPSVGSSEEDTYVRTIDPAKPMVALTFDDGPDETYTGRILDIFEENGALATFFLVGKYVSYFPDVVTRMAESGFEVGSHSYAHSQLTKLSTSALKEDMQKADTAIEAVIGSAPYLVRPPYGAVNSTVSAVAGRPMICWSVDTEDWKSRDAQTIIDYVQDYGDLDGEVILFHSIYESTADAMEVLVPWLQEQGYQLVTVTELMSYYYGEWPQPATTYWNYFFVNGKTDEPLPLPESGQLVAQPVDVPVTSPAPSQPTQPASPPEDPAPETPPETPPADPAPETPPEVPAPNTPLETPPVAPSDGGTPETPPVDPAPDAPPEDGEPPVTPEEPTIPPEEGDDGGGMPETPPQEGDTDAPPQEGTPQQSGEDTGPGTEDVP